MSRDIPVIFSAPMILALLAGRKTMTRRLAWRMDCGRRVEWSPTTWQKVTTGDRLWVRESIKRSEQLWRYSADEAKVMCASKHRGDAARWSDTRKQDYAPSIHMPRWASRITLVITETKVERLQDISEEDAIAEGVVEDDGSEPGIFYLPGAHAISGVNAPRGRSRIGQHASPQLVFRDLINNLHGAELWQQNPEVVALRFAAHKANIDATREAAE